MPEWKDTVNLPRTDLAATDTTTFGELIKAAQTALAAKPEATLAKV